MMNTPTPQAAVAAVPPLRVGAPYRPPEPRPVPDDPKPVKADERPAAPDLARWRWWIAGLLLAVLIILALRIGVGLGIGSTIHDLPPTLDAGTGDAGEDGG